MFRFAFVGNKEIHFRITFLSPVHEQNLFVWGEGVGGWGSGRGSSLADKAMCLENGETVLVYLQREREKELIQGTAISIFPHPRGRGVKKMVHFVIPSQSSIIYTVVGSKRKPPAGQGAQTYSPRSNGEWRHVDHLSSTQAT